MKITMLCAVACAALSAGAAQTGTPFGVEPEFTA